MKNVMVGAGRMAQNVVGLKPTNTIGERESFGTSTMRVAQGLYDIRSK